jgi:hypothetical protein
MHADGLSRLSEVGKILIDKQGAMMIIEGSLTSNK